jgi:RNA-splicing ligase RtcB
MSYFVNSKCWFIKIDELVEVVHQAGLSKKVAKLVPLVVIKGE